MIAKLADLTIVRGGAVVLDSVSLEVEAGQSILVQGAPGSGKTTLLLALSGGLPPTSGSRDVSVPVWWLMPGVPTRERLHHRVVASVQPAQPGLILSDEPLTLMPRLAAEEMTDALRTRRAQGHAVVVVAHPGDVPDMPFDKHLVVDGGRLCAPK